MAYMQYFNTQVFFNRFHPLDCHVLVEYFRLRSAERGPVHDSVVVSTDFLQLYWVSRIALLDALMHLSDTSIQRLRVHARRLGDCHGVVLKFNPTLMRVNDECACVLCSVAQHF